MTAYNMQGTPTVIVIDRNGMRRFQRFGHVDDLTLGSVIGAVLGEAAESSPVAGGSPPSCDSSGCLPTPL